jgi:glycolate oxidase iron-sulfur subunit
MHSSVQQPTFSDFTNQKANKVIGACVHCGFCLATCPTYQILGDELDSPRGRIYLMQSALENNQASFDTLKHLDRCLTCRSCETTCPSGVEYSQLLDIGRDFLETKRPFWQKSYRLFVRKFLTTPLLFKPIGYFFRHSNKVGYKLKAENSARKVLLLGGCVQPTLAPNINHSIKNILAKLNVAVVEGSQSQCCGAIDQHLSASEEAIHKAKKNIDAWQKQLDSGIEVILSSASGCGVMVKDYPKLFDIEDEYHAKALLISAHTQDIAEFLSKEDLSQLHLSEKNISYHEPCTLQHGQQLGGLVESILVQFGYTQVPIKDSHLCCGSAGTYSIFQPKLAKELRSNKITCLTKSNPAMIITSNIGCLMHLQKGSPIPVKHWVELLDG